MDDQLYTATATFRRIEVTDENRAELNAAEMDDASISALTMGSDVMIAVVRSDMPGVVAVLSAADFDSQYVPVPAAL